jgi:hypothetical protein
MRASNFVECFFNITELIIQLNGIAVIWHYRASHDGFGAVLLRQ